MILPSHAPSNNGVWPIPIHHGRSKRGRGIFSFFQWNRCQRNDFQRKRPPRIFPAGYFLEQTDNIAALLSHVRGVFHFCWPRVRRTAQNELRAAPFQGVHFQAGIVSEDTREKRPDVAAPMESDGFGGETWREFDGTFMAALPARFPASSDTTRRICAGKIIEREVSQIGRREYRFPDLMRVARGDVPVLSRGQNTSGGISRNQREQTSATANLIDKPFSAPILSMTEPADSPGDPRTYLAERAPFWRGFSGITLMSFRFCGGTLVCFFVNWRPVRSYGENARHRIFPASWRFCSFSSASW